MFDTNLESVHLSTAYIVVHSSSKDVHGILDHSSSMEESPTGHLSKEGKRKFSFSTQESGNKMFKSIASKFEVKICGYQVLQPDSCNHQAKIM